MKRLLVAFLAISGFMALVIAQEAVPPALYYDSEKIGTLNGKNVFLSDSSLKKWLETPLAGIPFWELYLPPFMRENNSLACEKILKNPPPTIAAASDWLHAVMAGDPLQKKGSG